MFANHTVATGGGKRLPPPELLVQQEVSFPFFSVHINIKRNIKKKLSMTWEKSLYRTIQCTADAPASPSPVY